MLKLALNKFQKDNTLLLKLIEFKEKKTISLGFEKQFKSNCWRIKKLSFATSMNDKIWFENVIVEQFYDFLAA